MHTYMDLLTFKLRKLEVPVHAYVSVYLYCRSVAAGEGHLAMSLNKQLLISFVMCRLTELST